MNLSTIVFYNQEGKMRSGEYDIYKILGGQRTGGEKQHNELGSTVEYPSTKLASHAQNTFLIFGGIE